MSKKHLFIMMASSLLFTGLSADDDDKKDKDDRDDIKQERQERKEERQQERQENRESRKDDRESRREERREQPRQDQVQERKFDRPDQNVIKQPDFQRRNRDSSRDRQIQQQNEAKNLQDARVRDARNRDFLRDRQIQQQNEAKNLQDARVRDARNRDFLRDRQIQQQNEAKNLRDARIRDDRVRDDKIRDDRRRDDERSRQEKSQGERFSRERLKEREVHWKERGKNVRHRFNDFRRRDHIFDDHFWSRFQRRYNHWYFDNRFIWSAEASWPSVVVWLPWKWNRPIYYYYGPNGEVYYSQSQDFTYLIPVESQTLFIAEAARIANTPQRLSRNQSDWMPLGMYALSYDAEGSDMPKEYISLAISKYGTVSGAYINVANNEMLEIQGAIDPQSQRVAWKFVGQDWPIMESGVYNLTQEESTLLVHTSSNRTESRVIVRVK